MATAKPILALVSYRERSAVRRQFERAGMSADEEPSEWIAPVAAD